MSIDTRQILADGAAQLSNATERAAGAAQRGMAALHDGSQQVLDRAHRASAATTTYIRTEPVKSMLFAAAAGAALMALLNLATRPRDRG